MKLFLVANLDYSALPRMVATGKYDNIQMDERCPM
jgi:hypothetical protein